MKKITFSLIFVFGLMGFNIAAIADETPSAQEPSGTDQYTEMLSQALSSLGASGGNLYSGLGGFNPMAFMNPMSMMGWGGQSVLGAERMMNPSNWMNPQTYAYIASPEAMTARLNPMNWMTMMNPTTYLPLMNPLAYMSMMGQAINPQTYVDMTKLMVTPEMYTKWYDATLEVAEKLGNTVD